jgi:integrase/recombinase XerC
MLTVALSQLENFYRHLVSERQVSPHTVSSYRIDLQYFCAYCEQHDIEPWLQVDSQHVRDFAAAEHRRGIAPRSIQRRLAAVRSLYRFLLREGIVRHNPGNTIAAPKGAKRLPAVLDADQMNRLLTFRADNSIDARDKAIMELFYSSGLRLAELINRTVHVLGKGSKERIVPIGRFAIEALNAWLRERSLVAQPETSAVFVASNGVRISARTVQYRLQGWAKKQGLGQHVHPHMFRHSFATHVLESSQDLRGVQEMLGHANIATTQIYTHLDFQHLAKIYDAAHPRAKLRKPKE